MMKIFYLNINLTIRFNELTIEENESEFLVIEIEIFEKLNI